MTLRLVWHALDVGPPAPDWGQRHDGPRPELEPEPDVTFHVADAEPGPDPDPDPGPDVRFYVDEEDPALYWDRLRGDGVFDVLYADPPWTFRNVKTGGSMTSGSAAQYPVLTLDRICDLPVQSIMAEDSVLFLWVPTTLGDHGAQVMREWGYQFKTKLYWHKSGARLGMGHWYRNQVEELWMGIRGRVPAFRSAVRNCVSTPVMGHSRKPPIFRHLIEQGAGRRFHVELFARPMDEAAAKMCGQSWTLMGNEIDHQDIGTAIRAEAATRTDAAILEAQRDVSRRALIRRLTGGC